MPFATKMKKSTTPTSPMMDKAKPFKKGGKVCG
jgi:hypothetical protein